MRNIWAVHKPTPFTEVSRRTTSSSVIDLSERKLGMVPSIILLANSRKVGHFERDNPTDRTNLSCAESIASGVSAPPKVSLRQRIIVEAAEFVKLRWITASATHRYFAPN
jgi:hypothetical protein